MAHITDIRIEGLLGRSDPVHLQLNRGVNVFFGENGCWKTTLLKVLEKFSTWPFALYRAFMGGMLLTSVWLGLL